MLSKLLLAVALAGSATYCFSEASAGDVVRWVDANGVAQFTDPRFAPHAPVVHIPPANVMDVPEAPTQRSQGRPNMVKIDKAPKKNKRGWRGHQGRSRGGSVYYR